MGNHLAVQWLLMIEGYPTIFTSHYLSASNIPTGLVARSSNQMAPFAIQPLTVQPDGQETVNVSTSLLEGGGYSLALNRKDSKDLLRAGPRGSDKEPLYLLDDILQSDTSPIGVNTSDTTGYSAGDNVFLGLETFVLTVVGPSSITMTREEYDSRTQSHLSLSNLEGGPPRIYDSCVNWRGRGARLFYADQRGEPSAADWVEVVRGYLPEPPSESPDKLSVNIHILPWHAALGQPIAGQGVSTTLQLGWHAYDGMHGVELLVGQQQSDSAYLPLIDGSARVSTAEEALEWPVGVLEVINEQVSESGTLSSAWPGNITVTEESITLEGQLSPAEDIEWKIVTDILQNGLGLLWYGLSLTPTEGAAADIIGDSRPNPRYRKHVADHNTQTLRDDAEPYALELPIRGCADAYYQTGEQWIWVADNMSQSTDPGKITIRWTEHNGEERGPYSLEYESIKAATVEFGAGFPGYLITLSDEVARNTPSFGSWPGQDPVRIWSGTSWNDAFVASVLLQILMSSEGNGERSSTYDVQSWGLGLTEDEVDIDSFTGATYLFRDVDYFFLEDAATVDEVIGSILRVNGLALSMRLVNGRKKLTLIPSTAAPVRSDAILTIEDEDWKVDRPSHELDTDLENTYEVQTAQNPVTGDDGPTIILPTLELIQAHGRVKRVYRETADWLTLSVYNGIKLFNASARRFALFGSHRIQITGTIAAGQAKPLYLGCIVEFTASDVSGYATEPLTNKLGRVIGLGFNPQNALAEITLLYHSLEASGYSPAAVVDSVYSTTAVDVEANTYTEATHPATGVAQTDASFFTAGDGVVAGPMTSRSTWTSLTIQSVSGNRITFTSAHGLSAGDVICADDHGSNPNTLDEYANMGSGDFYS